MRPSNKNVAVGEDKDKKIEVRTNTFIVHYVIYTHTLKSVLEEKEIFYKENIIASINLKIKIDELQNSFSKTF